MMLDAVSNGNHHSPHDILGPHSNGDAVTIRVSRQLADSVTIVTSTLTSAPPTIAGGGCYPRWRDSHRQVRATYGDFEATTDDGYRFLPTIGEIDRYLSWRRR